MSFLGPVQANPFLNENGAVLQKDLRPHLPFSYRFRPSTLKRRIRFENAFIPSGPMLKWTRRMRISIYPPAVKMAPLLILTVEWSGARSCLFWWRHFFQIAAFSPSTLENSVFKKQYICMQLELQCTQISRVQIRLLLNLVRDVTTALRMIMLEPWGVVRGSHRKENVTTYNLPITTQWPKKKNNSKNSLTVIMFSTGQHCRNEYDDFNLTCIALIWPVVSTIKFEVPCVFPVPERRKQYGTKLVILYANSVTKRFICVTLFGLNCTGERRVFGNLSVRFFRVIIDNCTVKRKKMGDFMYSSGLFIAKQSLSWILTLTHSLQSNNRNISNLLHHKS